MARRRIKPDAARGLRLFRCAMFGWVIGFAALACMAQSNEELFREYQFNFSLPGARANALGGAFIGLADDATSSFTNPAGLAYLRDPAITLEYRSRVEDSRIGQISGPINFSFEQRAQTFDGFSFFSINFRLREWYLAVFRASYLDQSQQRDFVSRSLSEGVETVSAIDVRLDLNGDMEGIGLARRLKNFKIGLSLNMSHLSAETRYTKEQLEIAPVVTERFYRSVIGDKDTQWGWTIGVLHEPHETWSWGAVWRRNPDFSVREHVEETVDGRKVRIADVDLRFGTPDVLGLGLRLRPQNRWNLLLDWQKIAYSDIISSGIQIVENPATEDATDYTVDDIEEWHLGVEWMLPLERHAWVFRAGSYINPVHLVRYVGDDPIQTALFSRSGRRDESHVTFGFGWVRHNVLQIDVSGNWWQAGHEITASFIWRKK